MSFWPKAFLEEIESKNINDGIILWSLSGPSFALRTPESLVYIDPYFGGNPAPEQYRTTAVPINPEEIRITNVVLSTHEHLDHCHNETLLPIQENTSSLFIGPSSSIKMMKGWGMDEKRIRELKSKDRLKIKDLNILALPAYDPNEPHAITFLVSVQGINIFFGGDTSLNQEMESIGNKYEIDIAVLSYGRTWYMSASEMIEFAGALRPKLLLPMHWELWRGHTGNLMALFKAIEGKKLAFQIELLMIGDYLYCKKDTEKKEGLIWNIKP